MLHSNPDGLTVLDGGLRMTTPRILFEVARQLPTSCFWPLCCLCNILRISSLLLLLSLSAATGSARRMVLITCADLAYCVRLARGASTRQVGGTPKQQRCRPDDMGRIRHAVCAATADAKKTDTSRRQVWKRTEAASASVTGSSPQIRRCH